jgi:hypothetical protein
MKTLREFSVAGPCIVLDAVIKETEVRVTFRDRNGTAKWINRRRWAVHTEPCVSCRAGGRESWVSAARESANLKMAELDFLGRVR